MDLNAIMEDCCMKIMGYKKKHSLTGFFVGIATSTVLLTGCGGTNQTHDSLNRPPNTSNQTTATNSTNANPSASVPASKIKIVAAENFWGEVAQAVGGDRVQVTSILNSPDVDPHEYEPTTDASKAVNDSQFVVYTGIGYDSWMDKVLKSSSNSSNKTVIRVGNDLIGKQDGDNPHIWYDPTTMPKLATKIADELAKLDPNQADAYHKRAQDYISTLSPISELIQKIKQSSATPIDVSEPVFDYMATALNLKPGDLKFAKAIEDGNDPSPGEVAQLQNDIKNKAIKLFVENIQTYSPTIKTMTALAKTNQIPVIEVTETEPSGKNYLQWMTDQLNQFATALGVK
jgi:zinc/manganese transport system substrate-binding protein